MCGDDFSGVYEMGMHMKPARSGPVHSVAIRGTALLFAATIGSIAFAAEPAAPASEPAQKPAPADRLVCKQEPVIGSNIKRKVCKPQSQIDEERDAARQGLNDLNKSAGRPQSAGG
jgi:hypothetical protein